MRLLFENARVLTMLGPDPIPASVGVEGNKIAFVGDRTNFAPDRTIDASGCLLMPGLVNTHCHASMSLLRGFADDLPLMEWLQKWVWPFEARMSADDMVLGAELGIAEMLLGGTTSFVDMYWNEHRIFEAADRMGIRAMLGASVLDSSWEAFSQDFSRLLERQTDRVRAAVAPHAPYTCSPETLLKSKELAVKHGLTYMTHVSETLDEVGIIKERYGKTSVEHLDALGVLDADTIAAHCVHLTNGDIATLAGRNVLVSHNAQSNMKLASGIAPVAAMLAQGVRVSLGTDGPCSNNDLDMFEELRTASLLAKVATGDPLALPAFQALQLATDGHTIAEGALADFILIDTRKPHLTPEFHAASSLAYCAKAADVRTVVVDGRILVEDGKLHGLQDLYEKAEKRAHELAVAKK